MFFHGPWGFFVDELAKSVTAITPACDGHLYLMGDTPVLTPMSAGLYCFVDAAVVQGIYPRVLLNAPIQAVIESVPSRFAVPDLQTDPRLHCSFRLPLTATQGLLLAPRTKPKTDEANLDNDNLFSGRNFRHLAQGNKCHTATLALVQLLQYTISDFDSLGLMSQSGASWAPTRVAAFHQDDCINLHLYAQSLSDGEDDHFAMMAELFNLDLHLDGDDAAKGVVLPTPIPLPKGMKREDLADISGRFGNWTANLGGPVGGKDGPGSSRTILHPLFCGGSLIIHPTAKRGSDTRNNVARKLPRNATGM